MIIKYGGYPKVKCCKCGVTREQDYMRLVDASGDGQSIRWQCNSDSVCDGIEDEIESLAVRAVGVVAGVAFAGLFAACWLL